MGPGMFDGLAETFMVLLVVCAIAVPLGIWKLIDLAIALSNHLSWH